MTEKWPKPLSLCFNPLVSFTVTVILAAVAVRQRGNERVYIEGGREALNTATLNEGRSVLRLNVREDADAQEGNVSSQEASSGSRWRRSESGAPFLLRHQPQRGVLVCD